jgi:hypothetical protein
MAFAADASLHEVSVAAEAGRMSEALDMMDKVLQDHPNSGKAHYVESELLAKEGRLASAKAELAKAEQLAPGLPFAKPQAVQKLRGRLSGTPTHEARQLTTAASPAAVSSGFSPTGLIIIVGSALVFLFFAARALIRRASPPLAGASTRFGGGNNFGNGYAPADPPMAPQGGGFGSGGGLGSGLLGGLATGAAVGAGVAAGEALVHHFTDGTRGSALPAPFQDSSFEAPQQYDMGGNDFGISDASSWDDSSAGGGDDWN